MTNEEKFQLITRNLEETLTEEELKKLIESETPLRHYIGFEISGKLHIGYLFQLMKVKDIQDAGGETIIWLADLHSAINDKLGGDLETIKRMANEYFIPAMESLFESIGGDPKKLIFKLCSEEYAKHPEFWFTFLEMAKNTSLSRSKKSMTIMGREEAEDNMETAKVMYPIMQAADIFLLQTNIAHAGMDQRKVHVIARESAFKIKTNALKDKNGNQIKPIAIHTPILLGLNLSKNFSDPTLEIQYTSGKVPEGTELNLDEIAMRLKMSKSKPGSGISIHDSKDEIFLKVNGAFAPPKQSEQNPILNWVRYLVFYDESAEFMVTEEEQHGGKKTIYKDYQSLEDDYKNGKLYPKPLKTALAEWLVEKLERVRQVFSDPIKRKALQEIEMITVR